ncbi:MAG: TSUP family transporter [Elusimicrobiales bacterium]|nr:TSUP family transporter [Elusimicrobiales bacterium]
MEFNQSIILLAILVFVAGFIDSIAGGGGIITIPAYLNYGITEKMVLGTNKLSSSIGTLAAVLKYIQEIKFPTSYLIIVAFFSAVFSSLGAYFISLLPSYLIKIIIFILTPPISVYLITSKEFGIKDFSENIPSKTKTFRTIFISSTVSFYDGMMGPGTGTFLAVGYSKLIGYDILKSTALAKFTNLVSNVSALLTFVVMKKLHFEIGLTMGFVSIIGNYLGAKVTLKKGVCIIKPLIIIISNIIILKLIIEAIKSS